MTKKDMQTRGCMNNYTEMIYLTYTITLPTISINRMMGRHHNLNGEESWQNAVNNCSINCEGHLNSQIIVATEFKPLL